MARTSGNDCALVALSKRMNTARTKFARVVRAILLLRALQTKAQRANRPFSRRETRTPHSTLTLRLTEFLLRSGDLAVSYQDKALLAFCFTVGC